MHILLFYIYCLYDNYIEDNYYIWYDYIYISVSNDNWRPFHDTKIEIHNMFDVEVKITIWKAKYVLKTIHNVCFYFLLINTISTYLHIWLDLLNSHVKLKLFVGFTRHQRKMYTFIMHLQNATMRYIKYLLL